MPSLNSNAHLVPVDFNLSGDFLQNLNLSWPFREFIYLESALGCFSRSWSKSLAKALHTTTRRPPGPITTRRQWVFKGEQNSLLWCRLFLDNISFKAFNLFVHSANPIVERYASTSIEIPNLRFPRPAHCAGNYVLRPNSPSRCNLWKARAKSTARNMPEHALYSFKSNSL